MVSFENFVKSMPPSLKVIPSFYFAFKIPDDVTATTTYNISKRAHFEAKAKKDKF